MRNVLVVANQTLGGTALLDEVRREMGSGPCSFHIVVPATPIADQFVYTQGEARYLAKERLERALADFRALGCEVTGEVGDARPLDAISDALSARHFEAILVSTLPAGLSRWLGMDLPTRIERTFGLPVVHVIAQAEPV